jgi:hypothetical protein
MERWTFVSWGVVSPAQVWRNNEGERFIVWKSSAHNHWTIITIDGHQAPLDSELIRLAQIMELAR